MSKTIALSQGKSTIIDDEDFEWASQFNWFAVRCHRKWGDTWYVRRHAAESEGGHERTFQLHREIAIRAGLPPSRRYDHRDGDGLNNQRSNIRPCTPQQNKANSRKSTGTTSSLKGVCWDKRSAKWLAQIRVDYKTKFLGYHATEEAAHAAYAKASKRHFGEFARTI